MRKCSNVIIFPVENPHSLPLAVLKTEGVSVYCGTLVILHPSTNPAPPCSLLRSDEIGHVQFRVVWPKITFVVLCSFKFVFVRWVSVAVSYSLLLNLISQLICFLISVCVLRSGSKIIYSFPLCVVFWSSHWLFCLCVLISLSFSFTSSFFQFRDALLQISQQYVLKILMKEANLLLTFCCKFSPLPNYTGFDINKLYLKQLLKASITPIQKRPRTPAHTRMKRLRTSVTWE